MNVLQEVEREVAAAMSARSTANSPTPGMQQAPMPAPPSAAPAVNSALVTPLPMPMPPHGAHATPIFSSHCTGGVCPLFWNSQHAQYAAIAAVLALALFYPNSLETFYQRIPKISGVLMQNDKFVRAALFAVVVYAILWKFRL